MGKSLKILIPSTGCFSQTSAVSLIPREDKAYQFSMIAAGPKGGSRLIPQVNDLDMGQVSKAGGFELSILVETFQRNLIANVGNKALLLGIPPCPAGNFDMLAVGFSSRPCRLE